VAERATTETRVGRITSARVFDPGANRDRCGRCERILITGQARCVCGAEFENAVSG